MQFRVLIVRLSQFRDVVKSTTHQFLYGECSRILPADCIDFAFLPSENDRKRHEQFVSNRTHVPAAEFDLILIANSYAVELINLPYLLKIAGIPYSSDKRRSSGTKPLIILGGSNALASQGILFSENEALTDAVYFGEGEKNVSEIVKILSECPSEKRRDALMQMQGNIKGLRVFGAPSSVVRKATYSGTNTELLANAKQALFDSSEAGTVRLMISYDCPSFCTFCFEGWERKPYREVPFPELIAAAKHLKMETGADTLEITAFNFNTHTDITRIITEMNKIFSQVNFMSQRADILASNSALAAYETAAGKRQYTLGAEGISEHMRSYFNKNLNEQTLLQAMSLLMNQNSVKEIKLFYILSGIESPEDFSDFRQFLAKIAELKTQYSSPARILCSFGLLVRMPFTPLRYEKLLMTEEAWKPVVEQTRFAVESAGYEFRLTYPYEEYFLSQTLVLTNQYIAPALVHFAEQNIVYDQTLPDGSWKMFTDMFPVTDEFTAEKSADYKFAYNTVDTHTAADFLYKRFLDAKSGKEMPSCMGAQCHGCGSCTEEQRTFLVQHTINMPNITDKTYISTLLAEKQRAKPVYISFEIPESMKHNRQETKNAYVMRTLMNAIDRTGTEGTTLISSVKDVLISFTGNIPNIYGKTQYAVYPFLNTQRESLLRALKNEGIQADDTQLIPEQFTITLQSYRSTGVQELEKSASSLLNSMHLSFVLSRKDGYTNLTIVPKALKKHIVNSCVVHDGKIIITCTNKTDFSAVTKSGFTAHIQF